jgi:hypothetical protein
MKHIKALMLVCLFVAASMAFAQDTKAPEGSSMKKEASHKEMKPSGKEMTVTGEVVDVSCYLAHGEKGMGADHKACAAHCATAGSPLGILTKDGKLYVSVLPDDHSAGPNAKLMDHVADQVSAKGLVRSKGGVNGIMITSVEPAGGGSDEMKK